MLMTWTCRVSQPCYEQSFGKTFTKLWLRATVLVCWTLSSQQALTEHPSGTVRNKKQGVCGLHLHGARASANSTFLVPTMWVSEWVRERGKVSQSCPALCDPVDYTVHGILQARIPEWAAFLYSRGSSQPRGLTQVSHIAGKFFTSWAKNNPPRNGTFMSKDPEMWWFGVNTKVTWSSRAPLQLTF